MNGKRASCGRRRSRARCPAPCLLLMATLAAPREAASQRDTIRTDVLEPAEVLAMLESGETTALNGASNVITAAFWHDFTTELAVHVGNYDRYTDAQRGALLDGLERIARGGPGIRARALTGAHAQITTLLHPQAPTPERWKREIPGRLLRIYRRSQDGTARALAVSNLGDALGLDPPEAPAIEQVLYDVATGPASPFPGWVPPETAVDALINAGQAGVPTLRRLHEGGEVKDMMLAARLRILASEGYPVRRRWGGPGAL